MKRNEGIQALRGVAIILIVLSHYNAVLGVFPWASSFGAIGVDIFVVISGFLSYALSQKFERVSVRKRIKITQSKIKKFSARTAILSESRIAATSWGCTS